jgi:competence protein ComEA
MHRPARIRRRRTHTNLFRGKHMYAIKAFLLSLLFSFAALAAGPVNINTADANTLATELNGVGMAKAEAIVAHREAKGPFKSVEQLADVRGIGLKIVEKNRDLLTVGGATKPAAKPAGGQ